MTPMGKRIDLYRVSLGKPEGKKPLGRRRPRWEDISKMDLQEVGCADEDCIQPPSDREVSGTCECNSEHSSYIKCGEILD